MTFSQKEVIFQLKNEIGTTYPYLIFNYNRDFVDFQTKIKHKKV
jgi:hypothetical protein